MMHACRSGVAALIVTVATLVPLAPPASCEPMVGDPPPAKTLWLEGNKLKLKTNIYQSEKLGSRPVLIVVLHGDLQGLRAVPSRTYHYVFADEASRRIKDVVVAAVLRPGYRDNSGDRSEGDAGLGTGDNYTPEAVDAVAQVTEQLKERFHPAYTVMFGYSGGAAITANLLGRVPSEVDGAVLASCPCDLVEWRKHMMQQRDNDPIWSAPIRGLSPLELAGSVSPSAHVAVFVGSQDEVAPPAMSRAYAEALKKRLRHVKLTVADGLGHDLLSDPATFDALITLVESLRKSGSAQD